MNYYRSKNLICRFQTLVFFILITDQLTSDDITRWTLVKKLTEKFKQYSERTNMCDNFFWIVNNKDMFIIFLTDCAQGQQYNIKAANQMFALIMKRHNLGGFEL